MTTMVMVAAIELSLEERHLLQQFVDDVFVYPSSTRLAGLKLPVLKLPVCTLPL